MANETLSVSEANKIIDNLGHVLDNCAYHMSDDLNTFLIGLNKIWADRIARELGQNIYKKSQAIMDVLSRNYNTMGQTLEDIVASYKKVGNMQEDFSVVRRYYKSKVNDKIMQEYFSDGNGDDFGFKDRINGPDTVMIILEEYTNNLQKVAEHVKWLIAGSNAFGNNDVTRELSNSGARIVEIVESATKEMQEEVREHIELAAKRYGLIGQAAREQMEKVTEAMKEKAEN